MSKDSPEAAGLFLEGGDPTADYYENLCGPARPISALKLLRDRKTITNSPLPALYPPLARVDETLGGMLQKRQLRRRVEAGPARGAAVRRRCGDRRSSSPAAPSPPFPRVRSPGLR